jgi:hypothetical protein
VTESPANSADSDDDYFAYLARRHRRVLAELRTGNALPTAPPFRRPDDLVAGLMVRTDFADEAAWQATVALTANRGPRYCEMQTCDDPAYAGLTPLQLEALAYPVEDLEYLAIADAQTMRDPNHAVLIMGLLEEPGRTFRCVPSKLVLIDVDLFFGSRDLASWADDSHNRSPA